MTVSLELVAAGRDVPAAEQVYLAQVFGPTYQGEGPTRGRLASFVRFAGCNLHCGWCDTKYTWSPSDGMRAWCRPVPIVDVLAFLRAAPVPLWVITGGEPLLHQRSQGMTDLVTAAADDGVDVEFETNGTIAPDLGRLGPGVRFNVSPKLAHAGDPERRRLVAHALAVFAHLATEGRATFKFVARGPGDLAEIAGIVDAHAIDDRAVWVMPEGTNAEKVLTTGRELADPVLRRGWNLTMRDHVLLWQDDPRR